MYGNNINAYKNEVWRIEASVKLLSEEISSDFKHKMSSKRRLITEEIAKNANVRDVSWTNLRLLKSSMFAIGQVQTDVHLIDLVKSFQEN